MTGTKEQSSKQNIKKKMEEVLHESVSDGGEALQQQPDWNLQKRWFSGANSTEKFPGRKSVDPRILSKYDTGMGVEPHRLVKGHKVHKLMRKEVKIKQAEEEAARAEILLTESSGFLEADEDSHTTLISQREIRQAVDITAATKSFDLRLDQFGPYRFRYSNNGRHLALAGLKGHLASFDWITKKLHTEINVMESVHDVCFLHTYQMLAAAQRKWVYIYDSHGVELHCLKQLNGVVSLEFLPYHFLLCSGSENGFLSWLDVTLGKEIIQFPTLKGWLGVLCQNPYNAVICCGHSNGTVTMWTPNSSKSVATVLCHNHPIKSMAIDQTGRYMATSGIDLQLKLWDARNLGSMLQCYRINHIASKMAFSQTGLLAAGMGNVVEVFRGVASFKPDCEIYMRHYTRGTIMDLHFCPYEDVLGVSTYREFSSLLIPGSGEPNFDALEANPYISRSGHREAEVKAVLSKVPSSLITLDPESIAQVDTPTLEEKLEEMKKLIHIKVPKIDTMPRYRMKGKSGSASKFKRKKLIAEDQKRKYLRGVMEKREELGIEPVRKETPANPSILERFRAKPKS